MSIWTDKQGRRHVGLMVKGRRVHRILEAGATASDAKQLEADLRSQLVATKPVAGDPLLVEVMPLYEEHAKTTRWPDRALVGSKRIHSLAATADQTKLKLMSWVKDTLDGHSLMNPGKVLPRASHPTNDSTHNGVEAHA